MADLYLYMGFARRLRFAEGLHPLVTETLVRRPEAVVLGAALPALPAVEPKGAGLFRRLFLGKKQRQMWTQFLEPKGEPNVRLVLAALEPRGNGNGKSSGAGPMVRFGLGLGVLAHQVLQAELASALAGTPDGEKASVERALARLWLQDEVASGGLAREWAPVKRFEDPSTEHTTLEQLNSALADVHGQPPGVDAITRWLKGLCAEVMPVAARGALPPAGPVSDDGVRHSLYEKDDGFRAHIDAARARVAFLANEIAPFLLGRDASADDFKKALEDGGKLKQPPVDGDASHNAEAWAQQVIELRQEHLERGRNPQAAYDEMSGAVLSAPGIPSEGGAPPPLPVDASGPMRRVPPPAPAHTQEISAVQIEEEGADGESATPPPAPTSTQAVSLDQIEAELGQQAEALGIPSPTTTQAVSLDQIEAEVGSATPAPGGFQAPAHTQQVSALDIEEAVAEQLANAPTVDAPTSTQQVSLDQIEAELGQLPNLAAPAHTQQVSAFQIEEAVAEQLAKATPDSPPPMADPTPPPVADPTPPPVAAATPPAAAPAAKPETPAATPAPPAASAAATPAAGGFQPGAVPVPRDGAPTPTPTPAAPTSGNGAAPESADGPKAAADQSGETDPGGA